MHLTFGSSKRGSLCMILCKRQQLFSQSPYHNYMNGHCFAYFCIGLTIFERSSLHCCIMLSTCSWRLLKNYLISSKSFWTILCKEGKEENFCIYFAFGENSIIFYIHLTEPNLSEFFFEVYKFTRIWMFLFSTMSPFFMPIHFKR